MNLRKKETQKEGSTNHGPVTKTLRSLYLHFREKDRRCIQVYLGNPQIFPQTAGRLPKGDLFLLIFQFFWNNHLWWRFCSSSCSVSTLEHSVFCRIYMVFFLPMAAQWVTCYSEEEATSGSKQKFLLKTKVNQSWVTAIFSVKAERMFLLRYFNEFTAKCEWMELIHQSLWYKNKRLGKKSYLTSWRHFTFHPRCFFSSKNNWWRVPD